MHTYQVTEACYVPLGPGFKYKKAGQLVNLSAADAKKLGGFVQRLDADKPGRSKVNTPDVATHDHAVGDPVGGQPEVVVAPVDLRTDSEREADEQADLARQELAEQPPDEGVQN